MGKISALADMNRPRDAAIYLTTVLPHPLANFRIIWFKPQLVKIEQATQRHAITCWRQLFGFSFCGRYLAGSKALWPQASVISDTTCYFRYPPKYRHHTKCHLKCQTKDHTLVFFPHLTPVASLNTTLSPRRRVLWISCPLDHFEILSNLTI